MFAATNIAGEIEEHRKLSAFTNNLTVLMGLLILGFPVTPATIKTTVSAWTLIAIAAMQLVVNRVRPQLCGREPTRCANELTISTMTPLERGTYTT